MRTMYDSISVDAIPADAQMVAGYVDGRWPTFTALETRFPHATRVSITVLGTAGANVADCETGDLTPQGAAGWAARELAAHRRPTIYCNANTWPTVEKTLGGIAPHVSIWLADYDGVADVPAGTVAKQYRSDTAQNLDYSVVVDYWPGVDPLPLPKPAPLPTHQTRADGKQTYQQYADSWRVPVESLWVEWNGPPYHPDPTHYARPPARGAYVWTFAQSAPPAPPPNPGPMPAWGSPSFLSWLGKIRTLLGKAWPWG